MIFYKQMISQIIKIINIYTYILLWYEGTKRKCSIFYCHAWGAPNHVRGVRTIPWKNSGLFYAGLGKNPGFTIQTQLKTWQQIQELSFTNIHSELSSSTRRQTLIVSTESVSHQPLFLYFVLFIYFVIYL